MRNNVIDFQPKETKKINKKKISYNNINYSSIINYKHFSNNILS